MILLLAFILVMLAIFAVLIVLVLGAGFIEARFPPKGQGAIASHARR